MYGDRSCVSDFTVALGGCGIGIVDLNARPPKLLPAERLVQARVSRLQALPDETLIEVADAQEPVSSCAPRARSTWRRASGQVEGTLVPEARIGGKIVYDVVQAESSARRARPG